MLLRRKGVDGAAPVCELAAGDFLIDFAGNVMDHFAGLARQVAMLHELARAERLDGERHVHDLGRMAVAGRQVD